MSDGAESGQADGDIVVARIEALRGLLHDICAATDAATLSPTWGTLSDASKPPVRLEIAGPPESPFARLVITAWPAEPYGVVDVVLRDPPWDVSMLEASFGPLRDAMTLESGARRLLAAWDDPDLPASALLQIWTSARGVDALTVRRDPRSRVDPVSPD